MGKRATEGLEDQPSKIRRPNPKECDLSTEEVRIWDNRLDNEGVVRERTFTSKIKALSISKVLRQIEGSAEVPIGKFVRYKLYPAFKEALSRILIKIEEALTDESNKLGIILIHGVPNIGKTTLARCLSYFLAIITGRKQTVHYMQLCHSKSVDREVITEAITSSPDEYVIVDQVNTNSLQFQEIVTFVRNRLKVTRMPLIMFTSGHYFPSEQWLSMQNSGMLCYKVITMQINPSVTSELMKTIEISEGDVISSDDLLKITTCYARMKQCLDHLLFNDIRSGGDVLRDVIYPGADIELIQTESAIHFIWLAWRNFVSEGLPPLDKFTDDHCKMEPAHVWYLGYLISGIKDTRDRGINAVLNLMDITGLAGYEKNGYIEFIPDSYSCKFSHKKRLHDVLSCVLDVEKEYSAEKKFTLLVAAFNQLTKEGDTQYQYLRGGLFELIINAISDRETERYGFPVGMAYVQAGLFHEDIFFIRVSHRKYVSTEIELCQLPLMHQKCKEKKVSFWCVLNVSGKPAFKGFDFAYLETRPHKNRPIVVKLQLFQITVNITGKSRETKLVMTDALGKITNELIDLKLISESDASQVVTPFLVDLSCGGGKINLPYQHSERLIAVDVVGFPKRFLNAKETIPFQ